jgi:hypothetical protein
MRRHERNGWLARCELNDSAWGSLRFRRNFSGLEIVRPSLVLRQQHGAERLHIGIAQQFDQGVRPFSVVDLIHLGDRKCCLVGFVHYPFSLPIIIPGPYYFPAEAVSPETKAQQDEKRHIAREFVNSRRKAGDPFIRYLDGFEMLSRKHADGLVDRFRDVTNERRGLHEWQFLRKWQGDTDKLTMPLSTSQRSASSAALEPETSLTDRSAIRNKRNM